MERFRLADKFFYLGPGDQSLKAVTFSGLRVRGTAAVPQAENFYGIHACGEKDLFGAVAFL